MKKVYRIENEKGEGPYRNEKDLSLNKWKDKNHIYEDHTHPTLYGDNFTTLNNLESAKLISEFVFGFSSINQLKKWFRITEIKRLSKHGFKIKKYIVKKPDYILQGRTKTQIMFLKEVSEKIN